MRAVIMAGGRGTRLAPFTRILPKPLIPFGDYPILEIIICQLRKAGFTDITLTLGYLAHLFEAYFADGQRLGVHIDYTYEDTPLGTAGPLSLIDRLDEPFLLMNGDLLTDLDFADMYNYHLEHNATVTMGLQTRKVDIEFGVIEVDQDSRITACREKPSFTYLINMGIYIVSPEAVAMIPYNQFYPFTDLVDLLLKRDENVFGYKFDGEWVDLGRIDDFSEATEKYRHLARAAEETFEEIERPMHLAALEQIEAT